MSKTLAQFITEIRADLDDAGSATWSDAELTRGVRRALHEYSNVKPLQVIGTIELSADGREIDITSLTGLIDVTRVWIDYHASDPGYPPQWGRFELWDDNTILFIDEEAEPQASEVLRIYYAKLHTIDGLDSESSTSVPTQDEELIILGACGYAAQIKARSSIEEIGPADTTPAQWNQWSNRRLAEFRRELSRLSDDMRASYDPRVKVDWEI